MVTVRHAVLCTWLKLFLNAKACISEPGKWLIKGTSSLTWAEVCPGTGVCFLHGNVPVRLLPVGTFCPFLSCSRLHVSQVSSLSRTFSSQVSPLFLRQSCGSPAEQVLCDFELRVTPIYSLVVPPQPAPDVKLLLGILLARAFTHLSFALAITGIVRKKKKV